MNEPQTQCSLCGAPILQRTADRFGGHCRPCHDRGGSPPRKPYQPTPEEIYEHTVLTSEVWNCEHAFEFQCPMEWSRLTQTGKSKIRHCSNCDQDVYLCETPSEFLENGNLGRCVAVSGLSLEGRELLGDPSPESLRELEILWARKREWWREFVELNPPFNAPECEILRKRLGSHQDNA